MVLSSPALEYGLSENFEIGAKLTLPAYIMLNVKHALLKENNKSPVSLALEAGYGYTKYSVTINNKEEGTTIHDLHILLPMSKDLTKSFTLYVSPRYIKRILKNSQTEPKTIDLKETIKSDMGSGSGLMFSLGRGNLLMIEYNKVTDTDDANHFMEHVGVGVTLPFD